MDCVACQPPLSRKFLRQEYSKVPLDIDKFVDRTTFTMLVLQLLKNIDSLTSNMDLLTLFIFH